MSGREWYLRSAIALWAVIAVGVAQPALGVGLLESLDLEITQGGNVLLSASGINTVGKLDGSTPIYLGPGGSAPEVWATITVDKYLQADEPDRNFMICINGEDGSGSPASLFEPLDDGDIEIRLTNMVFSDVTPTRWVEPFHPDYYRYPGIMGLPLFYMLNHNQGFVNLPAGIRYAPDIPPWHIIYPSVQVPKDVWTTSGYGFDKLNNGLNTGFELTAIPDVSGAGGLHTGAPDITRIDPDPGPPYFIDPVVPQSAPGFVDEIGIALNMMDVPEPTTALMVMMAVPLALRRRRRHSPSKRRK